MEEIKQIRGKWWTLGNPDNKISGSLSLNTNSRQILELDGNFPEIKIFRKDGDRMVLSSDIENISLILGYGFDGQKYSLVDCDYVGGRIFNITTQNFRVGILFEGIHLRHKNDIKMREVTVCFNYLNAWMNPKTITCTHDTELEKIQGKRIILHNIELNDSISLSLRTTTLPHFTLTRAILEQKNYFDISSKEPIDINSFFEIIFHFQEFLSFAMLYPAFATEIYAGDFISQESSNEEEVEEIPIPVKVYLSNSRISEQIKSKDLDFADAIFTFPELNGDAGSIIQNWFDLYRQQKSMLDLYFASVFTLKQYVESNFLSKVQCLEVFHRHSENYQKFVIDPQEHLKRVDAIKNQINGNEDLEVKHLKFYISKMKKFGNEPSLEQRINSILLSFPDIFSMFISDFNNFSKEVADNRNYLTHLEKKIGKTYPTNIELYYYAVKLEAILYVCILAELGFKKKTIVKIMGNFTSKKNLKKCI